ncbi:uncharacterized protein VTP21DRAFT_11366 [Calcarisporiella thermophila]|uniref:uncharacterized protein n=1 Tax=Calcarisporiella thermophila TaxID=911321 RepID=UPI003742F63E
MYTCQLLDAPLNTVCFNSADNTVDETENHLEESLDFRDSLLAADVFYFRFRLNSFTDLHHLLSAQYLIDGVLLPENPSHPQIHALATNREHTNYYAIHPDREIFLENYYRGDLEPALVHTAIACAAIHLLLLHPETTLKNKLHGAVGSLFAQAKRSLEGVFDIPSPQTVLALINMDTCLQLLSRYKDAYAFYSQAAQMALSLHMDKEDPTEKNPLQLEFQRRIWATVCKREIFYVFEGDKPALIGIDIIRSSIKPSVTMRDSEFYKFATIYFILNIMTTSKLLELQNIDWTLPDVIIVQKLAEIAAYLQNEQTEAVQYCSEGALHKIYPPGLNFNFWSKWCALWRQFIKSDAPTGRLETDLMQQLREKAFEEYIRGLNYCIMALGWAVNTQIRSQTHPNVRVGRKIFKELIKVLDILQSSEARGILIQCLARQIVDTLEEIKPTLFSKEVLERSA